MELKCSMTNRISNNRITERMAALKEKDRKALVSYIVNGDPHPDCTVSAMHALVESGTDIIELGIPFSDPMAEGPVIQLGHERALEHGVSLKDTLAKVKEFRQQNNETPIVLMGYANPIERMGYETFASAAAEAGVDGVITVDLPPEEANEFNETLSKHNLKNIFLLAPTTTIQRIRDIVSMASGFVYYVSLKGVTGAGHLDTESVKEKLRQIRQHTDLPICVGFGIKDGASAKAVGEYADGVVVGSVLVNEMGMQSDNQQQMLPALKSLVSEIRSGLDG